VNALAGGLRRALDASPEERKEIARRARELVKTRHDLPKYAERIAGLLRDARRNTPAAGREDAATR
jgi:spore maturation protein CgeB